MKKNLPIYTMLLSAIIASTAVATTAPEVIEKRSMLINDTAYIPPQCYTRTEDKGGKLHNPCYVCHARSMQPNYTNDYDLQLEYSFPEAATVNPWTNLFEDRRGRIAEISDETIRHYVRTDNYLTKDGSIKLQATLKDLPQEWDFDGDNSWDGYTPDCYFNFDAQGFDQTPTGEYTGWRAFGYHPLPSTFWPTNGAADDVMIRLPEAFRTDAENRFSYEVYAVNLAVVESVITKKDIAIPTTDEAKFGVDLNQNGKLDITTKIVFSWPATATKNMSYVGMAKQELENKKIQLVAGLFPKGTEFLHSVRYLDSHQQGEVTAAPRMKELRYMKKRTWQTYADLEEAALSEMKERDDFPDRVSQFIGNMEQGVNNGNGWILQGFIEDSKGELRPQTYEETVFCVGCHGGLGTTTDSTFSYARKLSDKGQNYGWLHWDPKYLVDLQEPKTELRGSGVFYEYSYYLMYNGSGNEFRSNDEVEKKYISSDGSLNQQELLALQEDVSRLLLPSNARAMTMNKAYKTIVEDQDYILGRDVNITPLDNVHKKVEQDLPTGISKATSPVRFGNHFGLTTAASELGANQQEKVAAVLGDSMGGPDGTKYDVNWQGIMRKSSYSSSIKGTQMLFPDRFTLPTRPIIPAMGNESCERCHREISGNAPKVHNRLTKDGHNRMTQISPDGKNIAFVSNRSGVDQIYLMEVGGAKQITTGSMSHSWPSWKNDSSKLLYVGLDETTGQYAIKEYDFAQRQENVLLQSKQKLDRPVYHPTKDIVAYAALTGNNWDLWLLNEERKRIRLTTAEDMDSNPLWSPDGNVIAYKIAPVGEYGLTGQNFLTFENGYKSPTIHVWDGPESVQMNQWSPDGSKITYTAEIISNSSGNERVSYVAMVSDLHLKDGKATAKNTKILSKGETLGDRGPVFSPDGKNILFWSWNRNFTAGLWLYDTVTDSVTPVNHKGEAMYPQWLSNNTFVFEAKDGDKAQLQISRLNTKGVAEKLALQ